MYKYKLTPANEDYLKTIFEICRKHNRASTNQIAEELNLSPASVTGMLKKLACFDPPLIDYKSHHGVKLTPTGEKISLELIRHHRLLELYLHKKLGYKWSEVHEEADILEHFISEKFEERIAQSLGNPTYDPHGDPIPDKDLNLPNSPSCSLASLKKPGQEAIIRRIENESSEFLSHLDSLGIGINTRITIQAYSPFDKNLTLLIEGQDTPIVVGLGITENLFVQLV